MIRFTTLILVFTLFSSAADSSQTGAIHALIDKCVHALNAKDVAEFGSVFTEDGEFTNPVGMTAKGRPAIEQFHAALFSENNKPSFAHAHLKLLDSSIRFLRPDVAAVDVRWSRPVQLIPSANHGARAEAS